MNDPINYDSVRLFHLKQNTVTSDTQAILWSEVSQLLDVSCKAVLETVKSIGNT